MGGLLAASGACLGFGFLTRPDAAILWFSLSVAARNMEVEASRQRHCFCAGPVFVLAVAYVVWEFVYYGDSF